VATSDAADSPLAGRAEEFSFVAGHVVLDFLNTVDHGSPESENLLRNTAALSAWGHRAGLITTDEPRGRSALELGAAIKLRTSLTSLLEARLSGGVGSAEDLQLLAEEVSAARGAARLEQAPDGSLSWFWEPQTLSTIRHVLAIRADELLAGPTSGRIGRCAGGSCGRFFLDATKRGNRRWCSMSTCGQAAKAARRRRGSAAAE
jgi:predicted RNA-binding Zn ribbon-like protein